MNAVTLVDGTIKTLEFNGEVVCGLCGEEYDFGVSYCDESLECATDEGESLIFL